MQTIEATATRLREAPLARCGNDEMQALLDRMEAVLAGLVEPLRVAILGEVKAGKSTLINALVGSEVAPADVLEASAIVTVVRHGHGMGTIHSIDGSSDERDVSEIVQVLEAHRGDADFASRTAYAELELPLGALRGLQLLDTPGLAASSPLPQKTLERLSEYDIVVWVFNASRQGESRALEEFERVGELGKPMLAVVNQIDRIPSEERQRLLEKFEREVDVYADDVVGLSALRALKGDEQALAGLRGHLEQHARQPDEAKVHATLRQLAAIVDAAAHLHLAAADHADAEEERLAAWQDRIERADVHVREEVDAAAGRWIRDEFLSSHTVALKQAAESSMSDLEEKLRFATSAESMQSEFERLIEHVRMTLEHAWDREGAAIQAELGDVGADASARVLQHLSRGDTALVASTGQGASSGDLLVSGSMGAAAGAGIAAYVALIGPAAPVIYLGSALAAFVPPLLIGGLAAGAIKVMVGRVNERRRRRQVLAETMDRLRRDFESQIWAEQLRPGVRELTKSMTATLVNTKPTHLLTGPSTSAGELRAFSGELRAGLEALADA